MRMDRSRWAARRGSPRWQGSPLAGVASASSAPADRRRTREVAGVRESGHHHDVAGLDLTVRYRMIQVDRNGGAEQVAAFVESIEVSRFGHLERFAPVVQEHPVWLIGDQQVDILGRQADSITHGKRYFGDLLVAASEHLGDVGFGEPDAGLTGAGLPPFAERVDNERHVAGVFAVGAALDVEYRRLVRHSD